MGRCSVTHTIQRYHWYFISVLLVDRGVLCFKAQVMAGTRGSPSCRGLPRLNKLALEGGSRHIGCRSSSVATPEVAAGDHLGSTREGERALFQHDMAAGDKRDISELPLGMVYLSCADCRLGLSTIVGMLPHWSMFGWRGGEGFWEGCPRGTLAVFGWGATSGLSDTLWDWES